MGLSYSLENIENFETACLGADGKPRFETEALIYGTLLLNLDAITENNLDEWLFRCMFCVRISLEWATVPAPEGLVPWYPGIKTLKAHVGLKTNVQAKTRAAWLRSTMRTLEADVEDAIREAKEQDGKTVLTPPEPRIIVPGGTP